MKVQATARVQITIEFRESLWGGDCTIEQLYKQAAEAGMNSLRTNLVNAKVPYIVISEPKVIGVITETNNS